MRYISPEAKHKAIDCETISSWQKRAKLIIDELKKAPPSEYSEIINKNSDMWSSLKPDFKKVSKGKCWYCESRNTRADNAIDHFRPKNSVAELPSHHGYWWLAFDIENYRYCCTFCNSRRKTKITEGGKQDSFPLKDEMKRAKAPDDDLRYEQPLLLDPTSSSDVALLWFDENGKPCGNPTFCKDTNSYSSIKVKKSIELYHLDHEDLNQERLFLAAKVKENLKDSDFLLKGYQAGEPSATLAINKIVGELKQMISSDEPHSSFVECYLKGLRGTYDIVDMII